MKIALIGYGKMGRLIDKIAQQKAHTIVSRMSRKVDHQALQDADICIDFSHPEAVLDNILHAATRGKNIVVGTTGWYDQLDTARKIVEKYGIGLFYAPNFSIGIHLFLKIVADAARLLDATEYDVGIVEEHHNKKADSPSGTGLALAQTLMNHMKRKTEVVKEIDGPIASHQLQISSLRCGSIPGTHHVHFDSPCDTITLTHQARSREGFASGAVTAAEWLIGKKGFYTIEDMLGGRHEKK